MAALDVRGQFVELRRARAMTQVEAAAHIAEVTMRPCSLRAVQSWEAEPGVVVSSRPCPAWALRALQTAGKVK